MGNSAPKLADTLFEMRFAAKQLERESRKREKAEAEQKKKVAQVSGLVPTYDERPASLCIYFITVPISISLILLL